ncbi:hypothetical protein YC2023_108618 [Brassica napus]
MFSTHRTSVGVRQHTQDVCGCPSAHTGRPWLTVCVRVYPWLSISTHISTLVLGLSTLALPVDCSGYFGPRGLSVQYTQDVCGCPSAYTGRPCVSVSTHRTFVAVLVCPCVSVNTHRTSVAVHQYTYQRSGPWTQHAGPSRGLFGTRMTTMAVRMCLCVFVSTHRTSVAVHQYTYQHVGPCTQHADPSRGLFGTHRTSVCFRGCPCVSVCGRLWLSISTHISTLVLGLSTLALPVNYSGDFGPHGLSVQYTQDVCGCPSAHTGRPCVSVSTHRTSVAVRVCPCVSVSTPRTSVAVHQYTYQHAGPWTQHAGPSRGLFGTSVAVRVCPCVSVSTHMTSVAVHQYTYQHAGPWTQHTGPSCGLFGTHISTLVLGLSTLTLPVDCSGDFGPRGLSVRYTQDVRGCPPAHTGRPWLSVSTHRTSVCVRQHTQDVSGCPSVSVCGRLWLSISTHISTLVLGLNTLALPVNYSGDFGPRGLSVQYTQDVCGCPSAHTGRSWLFLCVRVCPSAHTGRPWLSISTHISTLVLGLSTLTLPVDCSGDFGPRGQSVQHTQDVRGCPPAHTGRMWLSVSTHRTSVADRVCPCVSVCIRGCPSHTQDVCGCPPAHTGRLWLSVSTHRTSVCVQQQTQDVRGCPCVSVCGRLWLSISTHISTLVLGLSTLALPVNYSGDFGPRGLSVQYTQDVFGCPSAHTGRPCVSVSTYRTSVAVRVCPSAHTGRPWLSISTHISTLVLGLSTLALPVDCSGDFGPRGLSVQYTQDVCGCPSAHTGRPCVSVSTQRTSVAVRVCPCVSVSTHRTSVAVHQYTYQHAGPWTQHAGPSRGLFGTHISTLVLGLSTLTLPVDCSGDFGPRGLSVRYTQDVRGCPPAHTGRQWLSVSTHRTSVCVRQHTQDVRGCPCVSVCGRLWLSISTHISTLVLGLSTLALPVNYSGDFGPRGLSVQYNRTSVGVRQHTEDVRGCSCVSVCVRQHTQDVRGCPSVHISARCTHRTSVGVRQHTQDVCGCPSAHTGRPWLTVCVRVCPCVSVAVHQYTYQHAGPWTQHAGPSRGLFGTSVAVRVCPCVSVSTHRTSVTVHQYTYQHAGPWTQHAGPSRELFGTRMTSVAVRMCLCVSVSTHRTFVAVHQYTYQHVGPCTQHADPSRGLFGKSVAVRQHTQDVRVCPAANTGHPWLSVCVRVWTSVAVHQYIYQHIGPWTQHAGPTRELFGTFVAVPVCPCVSVSTHRTSMAVHHTHRTSVGVRQHTQDVRVCPSVSVSTHMTSVAVHQYTYPHVVHTGRPWVSASTHMTSVADGHTRTATDVMCVLTDSHGRPVCAGGHPRTSCVC